MKTERTQVRKTRQDMRFIFQRKTDVIVCIGEREKGVEPYFFTKSFSYLTYGGVKQARAEARHYRDKILKKYPHFLETNWRDKLRDPTKGVCISKTRPLAIATYLILEPDGTTIRRQKAVRFDRDDPQSIEHARIKAQQFRLQQNERYIRERENYDKVKRGMKK